MTLAACRRPPVPVRKRRGRPPGIPASNRAPSERDAGILARLTAPDRPTLAQVGAVYGLTRERVRQIAARQGFTESAYGPKAVQGPKFTRCPHCGSAYPPGTGALHRQGRDHRVGLFMRFVTRPAKGVDLDWHCWRWTGAGYPTGHGHFAWAEAGGYAHRAAYLLFVGPIPAGHWIAQTCRNHDCVNPAHLEALTPSQAIRRSTTHPMAINAARTHCIRGHEFTPENTARHNNGRRCRTCSRASSLARYHARRAAQA